MLQTQILQNIIQKQRCTATSGIGVVVTNPELVIFIEQASDKYYISKEAISIAKSIMFLSLLTLVPGVCFIFMLLQLKQNYNPKL